MKLSQKTIDEINRHCDPKNMLVINVAGIRRLRSPIQVKCIKAANMINEGSVVDVTAVKVTATSKLLYQVHGAYYSYRFFEILSKQ